MKCPICGNISESYERAFLKCRFCGLIFSRKPVFYPAADYQEKAKKEIYFKSRRKIFSKILEMLEWRKRFGKKLLDIGCAYGDFLEMAGESGWEAEGVEIDRKMVCRAEKRGFRIYSEPVEKLNIGGEYSAVTILEVLCLSEDPVSMAGKVYGILKPKGLLIAREFNALFHFGIAFRAMKAFNFLGIKPAISHNYNFTPRSIKILLSNAGFEDIKIRNSMPTSGDPYGTGGFFGGILTGMIKKAYFAFSQIVYFVTFRKVLISSALLITAEKGEK